MPKVRTFLALLILSLQLISCTSAGKETGDETPGNQVTATAVFEAQVQATSTSMVPDTGKEAATPTSGATATLAQGTYRNPVLDHDFADPDVIKVGDIYYAFSTNFKDADSQVNIQAAKSSDLVHWELVGEALPSLPNWSDPEFGWVWAPGVADPLSSDEYIMYYTARFTIGNGGMQCIGLATSPEPDGPYQPVGAEPAICQRSEGGSIDAEFFIDEDGSHYLLWKSDANSQGGAPDIYIQRISDDGLTLEGEPVILITVDQPWEGANVEAPTLWKQGSKYYLFYSAREYNRQNYLVGYAVADTPTGPFVKAEEPFLQTNLKAGIVGPGGQDVVIGPDGNTWMLFHMWTPGAYRALGLVRLDWEGDIPVLGPLTREPMPAP